MDQLAVALFEGAVKTQRYPFVEIQRTHHGPCCGTSTVITCCAPSSFVADMLAVGSFADAQFGFARFVVGPFAAVSFVAAVDTPSQLVVVDAG